MDFWGLQCYTYRVTDPTKYFSVKVQSYAGDPDVLVNPKYPITIWNSSKAEFKSQEDFKNEALLLSPETRKKHDALTGLYYICVFGRTYSNYKISAKNEDNTLALKAGISETGYIDMNETV